ncbi:MAG: glutamine--fructose-6-phosphate transaminase (isomerizing) [Kiritimatiellae bacterium]|jgi:glucosamine--fructose-6-phosphate aminotransferase (isomerizing)|nr:glutamine--fructose-6-phosphate transaminase (isomerizing) [Kiritimatiellia bacterium]
MCGIVGYVGYRGAPEILVNGLRKLEYRGYDSAGVAVVFDNEIKIAKTKGKVNNLAERIEKTWSEKLQTKATTGISHTRWATHGEPNEINAHPHLDNDGRTVLVHNGIIENCRALKARLLAEGHTFASETDTEVLAHLVGKYYKTDLIEAVCEALSKVEGTFGIAVLAKDKPDEIVVARKGSPIVIGVGDDETFVASDAAAIVAHTKNVIYLDDGDVAILTAGEVEVRTLENSPISREVSTLEFDADSAEKGEHKHFMHKEIFEQPDALRNAIGGRLDKDKATAILSGLSMSPREMAELRRFIMVACGTSMNAGLVGEYYFEDLADMITDVEQAAEFRYRNPIIGSQDMVLAISQSGETADTLAAIREAKQKGALISGLCNVVGSTIARETGRGVYLHAGPEIGVASTKAFTCQVAVLLMMALKFGRGRRLSRDVGQKLCAAISNIPKYAEETLKLDGQIRDIAKVYAGVEDVFFIGRGYMYPVALEGALKLKEISYIHAEGYHAAELKHGPIALLEPRVPVVALANDVPGKDKTIGNIEECKARNSPVIAVVTGDDPCVDGLADHIIRVPETPDVIAPITVAIALQLFAYHIAEFRGCEIDQPRNLAKSVTVE